MLQAIKCKLKKCCQITWRLLTLTVLEDFLGYLLKTFSISEPCSNHQPYDLDEPLMEFWLFLYFCFQYIFRGSIEFRFGKPEDFWIAGLCAELITNNIFTCDSISFWDQFNWLFALYCEHFDVQCCHAFQFCDQGPWLQLSLLQSQANDCFYVLIML